MTAARSYKKGAELDPWPYEHRDSDGELVDFSSGWTFSLTVATSKTAAAAVTKTTGITGLSTGVLVEWATTGELNSLTASDIPYVVQLRARRTSDSRDLDLADVFLTIVATNHA